MATCCTDLANIEKICGGGNAAGVRTKVYVACLDQVDTIPAATAGIISTDITMVADIGDGNPGVFYEINISKLNSNYNVEELGDEENPDYRHTLTFTILKMTPGKNVVLNSLDGGEVIGMFDDRNDYRWMMGDLKEGATFRALPQTGDVNGYVCTLSWRSAKRLYNYTGALSVAA